MDAYFKTFSHKIHREWWTGEICVANVNPGLSEHHVITDSNIYPDVTLNFTSYKKHFKEHVTWHLKIFHFSLASSDVALFCHCESTNRLCYMYVDNVYSLTHSNANIYWRYS
jgi:hypothetical protein